MIDDESEEKQREKDRLTFTQFAKKVGRPRVDIEDAVFDRLIQLPLTKLDLSWCLGVSASKLETYCDQRFGQSYEKVRRDNLEFMKTRILAKQFEVAFKGAGSEKMLIHLGEQYCDQVSRSKIEQTVMQEIEFKIGWADDYQPKATEKDVTPEIDSRIEKKV